MLNVGIFQTFIFISYFTAFAFNLKRNLRSKCFFFGGGHKRHLQLTTRERLPGNTMKTCADLGQKGLLSHRRLNYLYIYKAPARC